MKIIKRKTIEDFPEIATQWHPTKNGDLKPNYLTAGSKKKVYWICGKGHVWKAIIKNRTLLGRGCPYCSNQKVCFDNCLSTTHPEIATQWHPTKNGDLKPNHLTAGSHKKVYWICGKGHVWKAIINNRTRGRGCPYCSNQKVCFDNCLSKTHPEIATQWHPTKNGDLKPNYLTAGSDKKVYWICGKGHVWKAIINNRTRGRGCPKCKESKGEKKIKDFLNSNKFLFCREAVFKKCKMKNFLRFDFLVKISDKKGFLIEYQGEQHYKPIKRSNSWTDEDAINDLKLIKKRDEIKAKWAKDNKIPLLIIPYWDDKKIPELIIEFAKRLN